MACYCPLFMSLIFYILRSFFASGCEHINAMGQNQVQPSWTPFQRLLPVVGLPRPVLSDFPHVKETAIARSTFACVAVLPKRLMPGFLSKTKGFALCMPLSFPMSFPSSSPSNVPLEMHVWKATTSYRTMHNGAGNTHVRGSCGINTPHLQHHSGTQMQQYGINSISIGM